MRIIALIVGLLLVVPACATNLNHAEDINVDHFGATGSYHDSRSGSLCKMALFGGGGGGGGVGVGAGAFGLMVDSSQSQGDPRYFARSIVMVDLTKRLKSIKVASPALWTAHRSQPPPFPPPSPRRPRPGGRPGYRTIR